MGLSRFLSHVVDHMTYLPRRTDAVGWDFALSVENTEVLEKAREGDGVASGAGSSGTSEPSGM